ncbi:MAG: hypothetical protein CMD19_04945 [Flavobacteriales bacterium]|nr:hypothetical protein [Flavobacteriales bacterium]|tara:strand:+ start:7345 stop:8064 length:720 start_codon:yes stop_codon:yes gene_type:complete
MRLILLVAAAFFINTVSAQINLNTLKSAAVKAQSVIQTKNFSKDEVVKGLKEALIVGSTNAVINASESGGFNNNPEIKIPFPKEAKSMKKILLKFGMESQIDKFEHVLNKAAEDASGLAKDIFISAVKSMTINDAMSILKGKDNAATTYLKTHAVEELYLEFRPIVRNSIEKVNLEKYWDILAKRYNAIPITEDVNTSLEDYVTNQAIDGLFILIEEEELNIRNNPKARVSEVLQKVFR